MNLLKRIKESMSTKAHYPDQQLTDKQLELLNALDSYLVDNCAMPSADETLDVRLVQVGLMNQHLPASTIAKIIVKNLGELESYIPRSIALTTSGGDYQIFVGFRSNKANTTDSVIAMLYTDCLTRTNAARTQSNP